MKHGSLFSGIGGIDLGFEWAGFQSVWQVELDLFCNRILNKNFPFTERYADIKTVGKHNLEFVDVISGGFPCQDISVASSTKTGLRGGRSGLWYEMSRIISELQPKYVVIENVAQLLRNGINIVLEDLFRNGYDAEWSVLRASDFGAPHKRSRLFIVAYSNKVDGETRLGVEQNRTPQIFTGSTGERIPIWLQTADRFIGVDDGLSTRLYRPRVEALGNSVVPQIAEWIARKIILAENG